MDAGKVPRSAQAEAKGLYKWRDTIMVVEGFETHPDKKWFKLAIRYGARDVVAVDKTSVIHFGSARQAMMFEDYLKKSELGQDLRMSPHPLAPHYANFEIIGKVCQDGHCNNQEVSQTVKNDHRLQLKHTRYGPEDE